jgi:hypothetical protein
MAKYNVVTLSFGANSHSFYGRQDDHNHTKNKKFVQAATTLMAEQYRCNYNEIRGGDSLQINQNHPGTNGNELKWVDRESAWRRA